MTLRGSFATTDDMTLRGSFATTDDMTLRGTKTNPNEYDRYEHRIYF